MKTMPLKLACFFSCTAILMVQLVAQETSSPQAENTPKTEALVQFQTDLQPLLESKCLECHGEKEAKGGLRVDDLESLLGYVEIGNADSSSLWTDYLNTKDADAIMPPAHGAEAGGLSTADRLVFRTWINEGATGQWLASASNNEVKPVVSTIPTTLPGKLFAFQGLFHPAAVHLPIALIAVSSLFVLFSFFNREACEPVAYHCLWIGALGAVAACVTGWSYAAHEGYGAGFSFNLEGSDIDRHRWLGVFVAVFSLLMVPLARNVRRTANINKKVIWFFAGLIMLGAVSVVGFQGGELTYGEGHYVKYYNLLFGAPPSPPPVLTEEMTETILPGEESDRPSEQVSDQPSNSPNQPQVEPTPKTAEPTQPNSSGTDASKSEESPKSTDNPIAEPKADEASNPKTEPPQPNEPSSPDETSSPKSPSAPPEKADTPSQPTEPPQPIQDPPASESKL